MTDRAPRVEVVALVASAGGLAALARVLADLPVDLSAAFLVQMHLSSRSHLVDILERQSGRSVGWAAEGAEPAPGQVLVCPGGQRMELRPDGRIALLADGASVGGLVHDRLLGSLAAARGDSALAVVLTGMGHDGADGTAAIVAAGGLVIAQSVASAEHPSMPAAAAQAGAQLVLPLEEIPAAVAEAVGGAPLAVTGDEPRF